MRRADTLELPFSRPSVFEAGTTVANWPHVANVRISPRTTEQRISLGTHFDLGVVIGGRAIGAVARAVTCQESLVQIVGKSRLVESASLEFELQESDDLTLVTYDFQLRLSRLARSLKGPIIERIDAELPAFVTGFRQNVANDCAAKLTA